MAVEKVVPLADWLAYLKDRNSADQMVDLSVRHSADLLDTTKEPQMAALLVLWLVLLLEYLMVDNLVDSKVISSAAQ